MATRGRLHIGTSGWHYDHWAGPFYPSELPKRRWLSFYARHFRCVEVNSSFYGLPSPSTIQGWADQTPEEFLFAVKASRYITHRKKLKDSADAVRRFVDAIGPFGNRLGPVLFQLPPGWRCNPARLEAFVESLPVGLRYVFELRDPSWHTEEVAAILRARDLAFCVFEISGLRSPHWRTASLAYLRLHGPSLAYTGSYDARALRGWAEEIAAWRAAGSEVYCFFDNDERAYAARNALALAELCKD